MVINTHCHIVCKEIYSDGFWDGLAEGTAKATGIPKETIMKEMMPQNWALSGAVYSQVMDDAGIDKAFICHPDYGKSILGEAEWSIEKVNKWYIDQRDQMPDKFEVVVGIDPRRGDEGIKLIEKAAEEWGIKAVKIYPPCGFYPDDPKFDPFYDKLQELGLMLQSHTAALTHPFVENKYANPMYLDRIAARFPDLKILMVHFGGGFTTWTLGAIEIMAGRANVFAEFSGHQGAASAMTEYWLKLLRSILDTKALFGSPLKERIMFGSDWPYLLPYFEEKAWVEFFKNIPETGKQYGLKFTQEEINLILNENPKKILNL
ncbi:MAG: amidohydrolase family protein [Candidatus Hodarchaeota archaeon]